MLDDISQSTCFLFHVSLPIRTTVTDESLKKSSLTFCLIVSVFKLGFMSPISTDLDMYTSPNIFSNKSLYFSSFS